MNFNIIAICFKLLPASVVSRQARKPSGLIGRYLMTKLFNSGNADLNNFIKELLELKKNDNILEIGFGPGKLVKEIAEIITEGTVEGIDFSPTMVKEAKNANKHHITSGRVKLQKGESDNLPFSNETFDKLCTANTIYFWKEPEQHLIEMFRVIKPGGKLVLGFRDEKQMSNLNLDKNVFTTYSLDDVVNLFVKAGFTDAQIMEKEGQPFLSYCAVATKS